MTKLRELKTTTHCLSKIDELQPGKTLHSETGQLYAISPYNSLQQRVNQDSSQNKKGFKNYLTLKIKNPFVTRFSLKNYSARIQ